MKEPLTRRIFLSSTAQDLQEHRQAVASVIERLGDAPVRMEAFGAQPNDPVSVCVEKAAGSDAVVVIVAHRYGWVPSVAQGGDDHKSITWIEVDAARGAGKPVFVFLVAETYGWPHGKEQDDILEAQNEQATVAVFRKVQALGAFRKFLESEAGLTRDTFSTPEDLAVKVSTSLGRWVRAAAEDQPPRTAPNLTPALPSHHVTRENDLAELRALLLSDQQYKSVALRGLGGVGKTTLAIALCHDASVVAAFPDGVLWATLGPENADVTPTQLAWGAALRQDLSELREAGARTLRLRELLHSRRCLLVLDDVWDAQHLEMLQVGGPACATVVTTRERKIAQKVGTARELDVLEAHEAVALLQGWSGNSENTDSAVLLDELAKRLGYLPLALALAGAQVQDGTSWRSLLDAFRDSQGADVTRLDLDDPTLRTDSLALTFGLSVDRLGKEMSAQFALIGVFAFGREARFNAAAVAEVWQVPESEGVRSLQRMARAALLQRTDESYSIHLLVGSYARTRLARDQQEPAQARHAAHYLRVLEQSRQQWHHTEQALPQIRLAWSRVDKSDAMALHRWAAAGDEFFSRRGHWNQYLLWLLATAEAAKAQENNEVEAWSRGRMGQAYVALGRPDEALEHFNASLAVQRQLGQESEARALIEPMVTLLYRLGRLEDALQLLKSFTAPASSSGSAARSSNADVDESLDALLNTLALCRETGDQDREADLLEKVARMYQGHKDYAPALGHFQLCLNIYRSLGNVTREAEILTLIGNLQLESSAPAEAQESFTSALGIYRDIGGKTGEAEALYGIGQAQRAQQNPVDASKSLRDSLQIYEASGYLPMQANALEALASVEAILSFHTAGPDQLMRRAMEIWRSLGDTQRVAQSWLLLGDIHYALAGSLLRLNPDGLHDAYRCYSRALELFQSLDVPEDLDVVRSRLAEIAPALAERESQLSVRLKHSFAGGEDLYHSRGLVRLDRGDWAAAEADFTIAIEGAVGGAAAYFERGIARSEQGKHAPAEADFTVAIDAGFEDADARYRRGLLRLALDDYPGAEADFSEALNRQYDLSPEVYMKRAVARLGQGLFEPAATDVAWARFIAQNRDEALHAELEADCAAALARGHEQAGFYFGRGLARMQIGKREEALEDLTRAIESGGDIAEVYEARGRTRFALEQYAAACADFDAAVVRGGDQRGLFFARAWARKMVGDVSGAEQDFTAALDRGEDKAATLVERGDLRLSLQRYVDAEADLTAAIEQGQHTARVWLLRADARFSQAKHAEAEVDYSASIAVKGDDPRAWLGRARARICLSKIADAIEDLNAAIQFGKPSGGIYDSAGIYLIRGELLLRTGRLAEAGLDFSAAVEHGDDWRAYAWLGELLAIEHKYADAEAVCTRGIEKGFGNAELHQLRLYVNLRQGNIDILTRDSEYLVAHGPDEADTHARTADISLVSGNSAVAIDSYKRALELDPYSRRHFALALACLFDGQYDAAEDAYEEGIKDVNAFELQVALSELEFWSQQWAQRVAEPRFARAIAQFRERLESAGRGLSTAA